MPYILTCTAKIVEQYAKLLHILKLQVGILYASGGFVVCIYSIHIFLLKAVIVLRFVIVGYTWSVCKFSHVSTHSEHLIGNNLVSCPIFSGFSAVSIRLSGCIITVE